MKQPRGETGPRGTILAASRDERPVRTAARIAERRSYVAEMYPRLRPEAIAERLGVSESTIHADVNALAREGALEKVPQWPAREHRVCALDGCDEPVTHYGRGGYCKPAHWYAARRQRLAGRTFLCKCGCGREVYRRPSRVRSSGVFFSNECAGRYGVEHGTRGALLKSMHERGLLRGRRAQQLLGKAASRMPPAPGGRKRGRPAETVSAETAARIEKLRGRGWGYRAIASDLRLSPHAVRKHLGL